MVEEIIEPTFKEKVKSKIGQYTAFVKKYRIYFGLGVLLPIIGLTFLLVQTQQDLRQRASELTPVIARIEINPSGFQTDIGKSINLSTIAYDANNNPIGSGVIYRWGISSTNSIGSLSPVDGNISTFTPTANGYGDIFVTAVTSTQTLTYSVPVNVGPIIPTNTPTLTPTSTPTPITCDVNSDGRVNTKDYNFIKQCTNTKKAPNASCANADLNKDGSVNSTDLQLYLSKCTATQ